MTMPSRPSKRPLEAVSSSRSISANDAAVSGATAVGRLCGACESTRWRLSCARTGTGVELGWDREKHGTCRVDVRVERRRSSCTSR